MRIDFGPVNSGQSGPIKVESTNYPYSVVLPFIDSSFVNIWSMAEALKSMRAELRAGRGFRFFTLNLDHLCKLRKFPSFRFLYGAAEFVTADGWPIAFFARNKLAPIGQVTGADLVEPLCKLAADDGHPVFLFGTSDEALQSAAAILKERHASLVIAGQISPPHRFDPRSELATIYARTIADSGARICLVALGAPTQETFTDFSRSFCPSVGFVCIGAGLDFIAGTQRRAPLPIRKLKVEWAWRWMSSPRRLTARYLECICMFVWLLGKKYRAYAR